MGVIINIRQCNEDIAVFQERPIDVQELISLRTVENNMNQTKVMINQQSHVVLRSQRNVLLVLKNNRISFVLQTHFSCRFWLIPLNVIRLLLQTWHIISFLK